MFGTYGKETIKAEMVPDTIAGVKDAIMSEILVCEVCGRNFNIVPAELNFYRRENVPLPHECPNCRHARRVNLRLPRKLWHRKCMCEGQGTYRESQIAYRNTTPHFHGSDPCPNEFETSYAPERSEIVYCEQCYSVEVA